MGPQVTVEPGPLRALLRHCLLAPNISVIKPKNCLKPRRNFDVVWAANFSGKGPHISHNLTTEHVAKFSDNRPRDKLAKQSAAKQKGQRASRGERTAITK